MAAISMRALEAFNLVIESGSVSGAAEMMNVSQPAVSRLIRDLEDRTELRLFTRFGGKVVPTAEARELAVEVDRAFVGLAEIQRAAQAIRTGKRSTLSVASMPALANTILPDTLVDLMSANPETRITLLAMQTHEVVRRVALRQSQIGFTSPTRHEHDVDLIRTVDLPYYCILPAGHALAERERLSFDDLVDQRVVGYTDNTATGAMMDQRFARMRRAPDIVMRSHLSAVVSAMVLRGLGISLVDVFTARAHLESGGHAIPFDGDRPFRLAIIRPRGATLGADMETLLEAFYSHLPA